MYNVINMTSWLFVIPFLAMISGLLLYQKNGRREFLKFDMVQFFYAFVLAPMMFVWLKSFLFFILRDELGLGLSVTGLFVYDTVFSLVFMFVYAFVVIHSLTKSFENKRYKDPLFDVFSHSEVLHLWVSHTITYTGSAALLVFLSAVNLNFPLDVELGRVSFYLILLSGGILGIVLYAAIWLSVFQEQFLRLMQLLFGVVFLLHVLAYFVWSPAFGASLVVYWFNLSLFSMLVGLSFFFDKIDWLVERVERLMHKQGWSAKRKQYLLTK